MLHEKQFCVETKGLTLHKKRSCVDKNNLILLEKVFHVNQKKLMLHKKSISRRQKQDDGETKKYFVLKKKVINFFRNIPLLESLFN